MTQRMYGMAFSGLLLLACGAQRISAMPNLPTGVPAWMGAPAAFNDPPSQQGDTTVSESGHTQDMSNRTGVAILRVILTRVGKIDGKSITDIQIRNRCEMAFATSGGTVMIDWKHVGNYAGHFAGGRESFAINDDKSTHVISVPAGQQSEPVGNAGARVDGGFSVIADSCAR